MKNTIPFFIIIIITGLVLMIGKPTDDECILQVKQKAGLQLQGGGVLAGIINEVTDQGAAVALQVEDHIFYKSVISRLDGSVVGTGVMGYVFLNQ